MNEVSYLRNVCITINNYDSDSLTAIKGYNGIRYAIYGYEGKAEDATPHIQGYIEFTKSIRFTTLKKKLPTAHIEDRKGSDASAILTVLFVWGKGCTRLANAAVPA